MLRDMTLALTCEMRAAEEVENVRPIGRVPGTGRGPAYRSRDAARFLGVDADEFMRVVREGKIPCVCSGEQRRYLLKDLEAFRDRWARKDGGES